MSEFPAFGLNHVTTPMRNLDDLLTLASELDCIGVELRNDLPIPFLDGGSPDTIAGKFKHRNQRLLAVSEIKSFDDFSDWKLSEASKLIDIAHVCGAEAVSLIPRNDTNQIDCRDCSGNIKQALKELLPLLLDAGLKGFIEPLGFKTCSLRFKSEALDAIDAVGGADTFLLVHDTFHHFLAGEPDVFPAQTGIVHVSGVRRPPLPAMELQDEDRVLVDHQDQIENLQQLRLMLDGGYRGTISFESFAPEVQSLKNPKKALANSMNFIKNGI